MKPVREKCGWPTLADPRSPERRHRACLAGLTSPVTRSRQNVPCDPVGDAWRGPPGPPGQVGPQGIPGQPTAGGPFLPADGTLLPTSKTGLTPGTYWRNGDFVCIA